MKSDYTAIYKYRLGFGSYDIEIPGCIEILKAGEKGGQLFIWALCRPNEEGKAHHFEIYGTGDVIHEPNNLEHIDTVFDVAFVWHVFERSDPNFR